MAMTLSHDAVQELLGAYALDACEPGESVAIEAHLDECEVCAEEAFLLSDVAGWLGASGSGVAPAQLRGPVLAVARTQAPAAERRVAPTVVLFAEQIAAVDALLESLRPDEWEAPITPVPGWTVRDLVGHLAATETRLAQRLGAAPEVLPDLADVDLDSRSYGLVEQLRGGPPSAGQLLWREAADAVLRHIAGMTDEERRAPNDTYDIAIPLDRLLVGRCFELWMHAEDIRAAVGRPPERPSDEGMVLLTTSAVRSIPAALRFTGRDHPGRTAWIVLSGPGGGRWPLALGPGEEPSVPDVVISADAEAFCRVAGARLTPEELEHTVEGDAELARDVLASASAFARL